MIIYIYLIDFKDSLNETTTEERYQETIKNDTYIKLYS